MKTRASVLGCIVALGLAIVADCAAQPAKPSGGIESRLPGYLNNFLPFDPASKVTVEKAPETIPGFQSFKIKRTGKYPKLAVDRAFHVSDDGKFFFEGDAMTNPTPTPVHTNTDLA